MGQGERALKLASATHTTPNCVKCKCAHCIQHEEREIERGGAVQAPAVQGGRERERGVMLLCSPQTLEACCLCASRKLMLQTGGGFLAETKEYQSAFQGVTRQLAVSEGEAGGSSRDG